MCIITKNVSLLPWVVCVSGISSYFNGGSWTLYRSISVVVERVDGTLWSWVMNSRDVIPSITSDWWTIYVCEFAVTGWPPSSRHFYCLRSEMLLLQLLLMEHSSLSIYHLPHLQPGQRTLIISSFLLPKTSTSRLQLNLWIVIDNISSQLRELYNIVNYNSQPLIILLLCQHITICDYPPIPKNAIRHYNILSIAENWYFFLITNTYPNVYSTTPIPYRNCY